MDAKGRSVFVNSLLLSAEIEMNGMIAENDYRKSRNQDAIYDKKSFDEIIKKYSILRLAKYLTTSDEKFDRVCKKLENTLCCNEEEELCTP